MSTPETRDASKEEADHSESDQEEVSAQPSSSEKVADSAKKQNTEPSDDGSSPENEDEDEREGKDVNKEDQQYTQAQSVVQHDWQAVYSPQHNAYYFYNTKTFETTWKNPLEPQGSEVNDANANGAAAPTSTSLTYGYTNPGTASTAAETTDTHLDGIDPELAYLDPTLAVPGGTSNSAGTYSAKFNARTGRFTAMDGRDPSHLSEYERAKRMSSVFFDVNAWEQEVAARKAQEAAEEAEGKRRKKKPTKADLERYRAQKEARKKTKYAWLRE